MKIYIWEGDRISDAYHDDGTLVVLASSPAEARAIVRGLRNHKGHDDDWCGRCRDKFDGSDAALARRPDRTIDIDKPTWVAFNGGGYD